MAEVVNPYKLTPETTQKLEEAFSIGADTPAACFYAEISEQTYYNWVKSFPELKEKFERLRQKPVLKAYQAIAKGLDNPELALKYLERKRKDEFSVRNEYSFDAKYDDTLKDIKGVILMASGNYGTAQFKPAIPDKQLAADFNQGTTEDIQRDTDQKKETGDNDHADPIRQEPDGGDSGTPPSG